MITKMEVFSAQPSAPELSLAGTLASDDPIHIRDIQGLEPVTAEIATSPFATSDGVLITGSSVGKRNIVLTLGFSPSWEGSQSIATLRQLLYAYLLPKSWTKLRFFSDELPVVDIEGYVESLKPNIFSQDPEVQCSIICPRPDFIDADAVIISGNVDDGTTENVIDYIGTVPTGFELRVQRTVANPSYTGPITVTNVDNELEPQIFSIDPVTVDVLKSFKLSTVKGHKRAGNVAVADGAFTNLLANVETGVWPELRFGENVITVEATENDQLWTLAYFNRFGGL